MAALITAALAYGIGWLIARNLKSLWWSALAFFLAIVCVPLTGFVIGWYAAQTIDAAKQDAALGGMAFGIASALMVTPLGYYLGRKSRRQKPELVN